MAENHPTTEYIAQRLGVFQKRYTVDPVTGCWIWDKARAGNGKFPHGRYGNFYFWGRQIGAHVASYWIHRGPVPNGLEVMHLCDFGPCVNPSHLRLGDHSDNMRDCYLKGRQNRSDTHGDKNPKAKLTQEQMDWLSSLSPVSWDEAKSLATRLGITPEGVNYHIRRKKKVSEGGGWEIVKELNS